MKSSLTKLLLFAAVAIMLAGTPLSAEACTACFGDPNSDAVKGVAWAIIFLGVVVMSVMGCVGGFFIFIAKRAATSGDPTTEPTAPNTDS